MEAIVPIISSFLTGIFFIIFVIMVKDFLAKTFSIAVAEYLIKVANDEVRQKLVRWFANSKEVLEQLKEIDEALKKK